MHTQVAMQVSSKVQYYYISVVYIVHRYVAHNVISIKLSLVTNDKKNYTLLTMEQKGRRNNYTRRLTKRSFKKNFFWSL